MNHITISKSPSRRIKTAVVVAVIMFVFTFLFHYIYISVLPSNGNALTDWKFFCGATAESVEGNNVQYKQATAENPPSKEFKKPYMRLQYTVTGSSYDRIFSLKTAYSPVKIALNNKVLYNNGFGKKSFTGSCFQSVSIPVTGEEQIIDVYMFAPLSFEFSAELTSKSISATTLFARYFGFALSIAVTLCGIALFVLSVIMTANSKNIKRMLLLSFTVFLGGITGAIYSLSQTTDILTAFWAFPVIILLQMILMALMFLSVISCCKTAAKTAWVFLPALIELLIIPVFGTAWSVRLAAAVFAVAEIYISVQSLSAFSKAVTADVPHIGAVSGLMLFAALISVYNTCAMFLGVSLLSGYLYFYSISLLCLVLYVVFCKQIIFLDIKKDERIDQIYKDSAWIEGLTGLISHMFLQKDEMTFITEVAQGLSEIIERNAETDEKIDVHSCIGVSVGGKYTESYNFGNLENCDYAGIAKHLEESDTHLLIGNTTVDMLFVSDKHKAVIHFENILCGIYGNIVNIIKAAYSNLSVAYQNLNLKNDMSDMQEELFIHLAGVVEQRSYATNQHQIAVAALTYEICRELGMNENRAKLLSIASMAHDIGKIAISESILNKNGQLKPDEFEVMKKHTDYGYNILSLQNGEFFRAASMIALEHHENFDGTGYSGKKGREIDPGARIVHVIDVFEALLSKRSYKEAWGEKAACKYISEQSGKMFDPAVCEGFAKCSDRLINLRKSVYAEDNYENV